MVLNRKGLRRSLENKRRLSAGGAGASKGIGTAPNANIKVVVRVRPESEREKQGNYRTVVSVVDDKMLIFDPKDGSDVFFYHGVKQKTRDMLKRQCKEMKFMFDEVFDQDASNEDIFLKSTREVIDALMDGYNCSVFAYGATGAGKTYTMLGAQENPGITFRTVMQLYNRLKELEGKTWEISISYLEVYNEGVQDLMSPSGPLSIREDGNSGVIINGLTSHKPSGPEQLLEMLRFGNSNRSQHPTDANAESSRSHAVFQVILKLRDQSAASGSVKMAKLSMIDLAGSEKGAATGFTGARFREGANINKSLLALGNCINALAEGLKHIPYRNSKLTRLLKDSLGGNCRTVMIANVSPSSLSFEDTYNTLKYADRAKKIKTSLKMNIVSMEMHLSQYPKIIEALKKEVMELKEQLKKAMEVKVEETVAPQESATAHVARSEEELEFRDGLDKLYEERREIRTHLLGLDSLIKETMLKLYWKKLKMERVIVAGVASAVVAKSTVRSEKFVRTLQKKIDTLRDKFISAQEKREMNDREVAAIQEKIKALQPEKVEESENVPSFLEQHDLNNKLQTENADLRVQVSHLQKAFSLQREEMVVQEELLTQFLRFSRKYYLLLNGYKFATPEMQEEFNRHVALLEGARGVCWADEKEAVKPGFNFESVASVSVSPTPNEDFSKWMSDLAPPSKGKWDDLYLNPFAQERMKSHSQDSLLSGVSFHPPFYANSFMNSGQMATPYNFYRPYNFPDQRFQRSHSVSCATNNTYSGDVSPASENVFEVSGVNKLSPVANVSLNDESPVNNTFTKLPVSSPRPGLNTTIDVNSPLVIAKRSLSSEFLTYIEDSNKELQQNTLPSTTAIPVQLEVQSSDCVWTDENPEVVEGEVVESPALQHLIRRDSLRSLPNKVNAEIPSINLKETTKVVHPGKENKVPKKKVGVMQPYPLKSPKFGAVTLGQGTSNSAKKKLTTSRSVGDLRSGKLQVPMVGSGQPSCKNVLLGSKTKRKCPNDRSQPSPGGKAMHQGFGPNKKLTKYASTTALNANLHTVPR